MWLDPLAWLASILGSVTDPVVFLPMAIAGLVAKRRWPIIATAVCISGLGAFLDRVFLPQSGVTPDQVTLLRELCLPIAACAVGFGVRETKAFILRHI